jgi:hypothetical protein
MIGSEQNGAMAYMNMVVHGGIVNNAGLAIKIAEAIIEDFYGTDVIESQKPLAVFDRDSRWEVVGSSQDVSENQKRGPVMISISKIDCQVLDLAYPVFLPDPR